MEYDETWPEMDIEMFIYGLLSNNDIIKQNIIRLVDRVDLNYKTILVTGHAGFIGSMSCVPSLL